MHRIGPAMVAALGLALAVPASSGAATSCPKPPTLDPSNFPSQPKVDNPYFPLTPGKTYVYKGKQDGEPAEDDFAITNDSKVIDGVRTRVVHDQVLVKNKLTEDTLDYYAQDKQGTVWYLGEDTKEFDSNGQVISTEGSFQAGVNNASGGIFMPANPRVGQVFKQEDAKNVAEDCFQVLDLNASVKTPYVASDHALRTKEFTRLEPGVIDNKWYVRGIGEVREETIRGGSDFIELVSVK